MFSRNVVLGIVLGVGVLGLFGYLLAGKEGAVNGAYACDDIDGNWRTGKNRNQVY
jgi:hypothetical protein